MLKYFFEVILKWRDEDFKKFYSREIYEKYKLYSMIIIRFQYSVFAPLEFTYPGRFKEWELPHVPRNFWTSENKKLAIRWLIEDKLKCSKEEAKVKLKTKTFYKNGLRSLLDKSFNSSPSMAFKFAYSDVVDKSTEL